MQIIRGKPGLQGFGPGTEGEAVTN